MAFDVKAKSTYDDCLLFEAGELKKLSRFSGFFNVTVLFACVDLDKPEQFVWVSLARPVVAAGGTGAGKPPWWRFQSPRPSRSAQPSRSWRRFSASAARPLRSDPKNGAGS